MDGSCGRGLEAGRPRCMGRGRSTQHRSHGRVIDDGHGLLHRGVASVGGAWRWWARSPLRRSDGRTCAADSQSATGLRAAFGGWRTLGRAPDPCSRCAGDDSSASRSIGSYPFRRASYAVGSGAIRADAPSASGCYSRGNLGIALVTPGRVSRHIAPPYRHDRAGATAGAGAASRNIGRAGGAASDGPYGSTDSCGGGVRAATSTGAGTPCRAGGIDHRSACRIVH